MIKSLINSATVNIDAKIDRRVYRKCIRVT